MLLSQPSSSDYLLLWWSWSLEIPLLCTFCCTFFVVGGGFFWHFARAWKVEEHLDMFGSDEQRSGRIVRTAQ